MKQKFLKELTDFIENEVGEICSECKVTFVPTSEKNSLGLNLMVSYNSTSMIHTNNMLDNILFERDKKLISKFLRNKMIKLAQYLATRSLEIEHNAKTLVTK